MIKYIRAITVIFSFFIFGLCSFVLGTIIFPFIHFLKKEKKERVYLYSKIIKKSWYFFINFLMITKVFKINIKNIDKLKNIKNSVIVATHPTYCDVLILIALIPNTTCFAAEKLSRNFFMKNVVKTMFLTAAQPIEDIVKDSKYMLDIGFNILIFPMGKRHKKDEFPKIRKGAAQIAIHTNKNIVPIKVNTNIDFLPGHEPIYHAGDRLVIYDIEALDSINIEDFKQKYTDEVTLKKEITKEITDKLYK